jgi:hypothetical protein
MTRMIELDETDVPAWMFDILVLFRDDRANGGCCGWDGDPEGRRDPDCIHCAAWEHGEEAYWLGQYRRASLAETAPDGYATEMRAAGRGHLLRGVA